MACLRRRPFFSTVRGVAIGANGGAAAHDDVSVVDETVDVDGPGDGIGGVDGPGDGIGGVDGPGDVEETVGVDETVEEGERDCGTRTSVR
jgi:hypothetical protein